MARSLHICEVYDSPTNNQPWRGVWSPDKAMQHLADLRGKAFAPDLTEVFLDVVVSTVTDEKPVTDAT